MWCSLVGRLWGPGGLRLLLGDAAVLVVLVAAIVFASFPRATRAVAVRAEVLVSGQVVATLDLGRDDIHEVQGPLGTTRLEVRGGRVHVMSAPCPAQVCRHSGWISEPGELLVCLPNEVVVRMPGQTAAGPDARSR